MKAKTIKAILRKKVDDWLSSIEDQSVRDLAAKNTIVTGGCIASMLLREPINDFDLYFRDKATTKAVAEYYVQRFKVEQRAGIPVALFVDDGNKESPKEGRIRVIATSAGIASEDGTAKPYEYFEMAPEGAADYVSGVMQDPGDIEDFVERVEEDFPAQQEDPVKPKYRPVFLTTNAITLSHQVQLVLRFYGEPDEVHANYDFVHCTNYWDSRDGSLTLRPAALEALLARELRYVGSKYPICSLIRMRKFIRRGWSINAGQVLKMAWQVSELDLSNVSVLQDQLTGVDVAYFLQVIDALKAKDQERVDGAYLVEILNRMF